MKRGHDGSGRDDPYDDGRMEKYWRQASTDSLSSVELLRVCTQLLVIAHRSENMLQALMPLVERAPQHPALSRRPLPFSPLPGQENRQESRRYSSSSSSSAAAAYLPYDRRRNDEQEYEEEIVEVDPPPSLGFSHPNRRSVPVERQVERQVERPAERQGPRQERPAERAPPTKGVKKVWSDEDTMYLLQLRLDHKVPGKKTKWTHLFDVDAATVGRFAGLSPDKIKNKYCNLKKADNIPPEFQDDDSE